MMNPTLVIGYHMRLTQVCPNIIGVGVSEHYTSHSKGQRSAVVHISLHSMQRAGNFPYCISRPTFNSTWWKCFLDMQPEETRP